ncbi:MAG: xanthine phosphoribosyltransferase [Salinivirgaceae bacterium]|nr:xanthine phosphoribosyltransferase [Salinivirgaceae bacterium]
MNFLEEKILADGKVFEGNVLKVDNFLNHQIDIDVMRQVACEFKRRFKGIQVDKILTIEASGIAIAVMLAAMYDVPVVFAKKSQTVNSVDDKYVSQAYSFTHKKMNNVFVSRPYLSAGENILIVDDFLADGKAANALIDIVEQAGGHVVGVGVAIEKGQQNGGRDLRQRGIKLESLAIIESMDYATQKIIFRNQQ